MRRNCLRGGLAVSRVSTSRLFNVEADLRDRHRIRKSQSIMGRSRGWPSSSYQVSMMLQPRLVKPVLIAKKTPRPPPWLSNDTQMRLLRDSDLANCPRTAISRRAEHGAICECHRREGVQLSGCCGVD